MNLGGSQSVTITAPSGDLIYYTLDGTYPSVSSALYNGPLVVTGNETLTVRAYNPVTGQWSDDTAEAHYRNYGWIAGDQWYAQNDYGNPVAANGGGIIYTNGKYYLVGEYLAGGTNSNIPYPTDIGGIWLYSSADLYNWDFEGVILGPSSQGGIDSRPHIIYNAATQTYVLWDTCTVGATDANGTDYACVATAPAVTGPWTWRKLSLNPDGHGFKDNNLFEDDDGSAYVVYQDAAQSNIYVSKLTADYMSTSSQSVIACACSAQESPVMFKRNGVYFLIHGASNLTNYQQDINPVYQTAASPLGTWSSQLGLFATDPVGTYYNGQPGSVFQIQGKTDAWAYLSDLWRSPITDTTHILLPLSFSDSTHVQAQTPSAWDLSYFP